MNKKEEWRVSLHGGHSGEFCDHAHGTLREILEAAVQAGYSTFGVSEHAPRSEAYFLYSEERAKKWNVTKLLADFERYTAAINQLPAEFADRLTVLRGFEAEVVPTASYVSEMKELRSRRLPDGSPAFDYMVGSVHFVNEIQIDGQPEHYALAVENCGGLENFAVRYYEIVAEMIRALRPEVVGHLDLVKRNAALAGFDPAALETQRIFLAAQSALSAAREQNCILDLNTAGWRKGLGEPYPSPALVKMALEIGVPFCFGDDSHRAAEVGAGVDVARDYLLENGVNSITTLTRGTGTNEIARRQINLK